MPKRKKSSKRKITAARRLAMQEGKKKKAAVKKEGAKQCQVKGCNTMMVQNSTELRKGWYWCPRCNRYTEPPMGSPET